MLQKIRDQAGSWFIKLLFGFLVLCFCFWGVGDVFRNYGNTRPLLSVGSFTVSLEEFSRKFRQMQGDMQSTAAQPLTAEQIKQLDLGSKVLEQFTAQGLLRQEVLANKLVVADETVRANLHSIPMFHDTNHIFSPDYFRKILQHNHITEAKFINDLRLGLLQTQLLQPFTKAQYLPPSYTKLLFRGINQSYIFNVVEIPLNKLPLAAVPNNEVLKVFYEQNRDRFMLPERRFISVVNLDINLLKKAVALSDERLRTEYEQRIDDFAIPEQRSIEELIVNNEYAEDALERLQRGQSMSDVAKALKAERRSIVEVTRAELSPDVADAVFADKAPPFITTPLKTSLGTQIIAVSKIQPQATKEFAEVRTDLEATLRETIANEQYKDLYAKIEDELAGGATLKDVAQENGLPFCTSGNMDAQGRDGQFLISWNWKQDMLQKIADIAFSTAEGSDSQLTEITNSSSSVILHVDKVIPAHVPDFANTQAAVINEWQKDNRYEAAAKLADQLAQAKSQLEFKQEAQRGGFKVQSLSVSRAMVAKDSVTRQRFTETLWHDIFSLRPGKAIAGPNIPSSNKGNLKESFVVAFLVNIKPYDMRLSQKQYMAFEKLLQKAVAHDIENSFINGLRDIYSVEVNTSMLETATAVSGSESQ